MSDAMSTKTEYTNHIKLLRFSDKLRNERTNKKRENGPITKKICKNIKILEVLQKAKGTGSFSARIRIQGDLI